MINKEEFTTVQITKETRDNLKRLRITKRESYEEIFKRIIKMEIKN